MPIEIWLGMLPSPVREEAIHNYLHQYNNTAMSVGWKEEQECLSLYEAVFQAFVWSKTKEGFKYWEDVYSVLNP